MGKIGYYTTLGAIAVASAFAGKKGMDYHELAREFHRVRPASMERIVELDTLISEIDTRLQEERTLTRSGSDSINQALGDLYTKSKENEERLLDARQLALEEQDDIQMSREVREYATARRKHSAYAEKASGWLFGALMGAFCVAANGIKILQECYQRKYAPSQSETEEAKGEQSQ